MHMRMRKKGRKAPKLGKNSRYLLKYDRDELFKKSLTKRLYALVLHRSECTTTEIYNSLKARGFDGEKNIVRRYLNTMYEYGLVEKTIRGANIDYWSLSKDRHSIAEEELLREIDIDILKNFYSPSQMFHIRGTDFPDRPSTAAGVHLYGLPWRYILKKSEKIQALLEEVFNSFSSINDQLHLLLELRFKMMFESFSDKINDWKKRYPGAWDEAILFVCFCSYRKPPPDSLIAHLKETGNLPPGFVNQPFAPWIKDVDEEAIIIYTKEDTTDILMMAKALKKSYFPSLTIPEILKKLYAYHIPKATINLSLSMKQELAETENPPISIVATHHASQEFMESMYGSFYGKRTTFLDEKLLREKKVIEKETGIPFYFQIVKDENGEPFAIENKERGLFVRVKKNEDGSFYIDETDKEQRDKLLFHLLKDKRYHDNLMFVFSKPGEEVNKAEIEESFRQRDAQRTAEFVDANSLLFKSFFNSCKSASKDARSPASPKKG